MSEHIMAAIDASPFSASVCDYACWSSRALGAPLTLLHAVDNHPQNAEPDLTGNIGLGSRENLLEELATLDEKRARLAQEHARHMLEASRLRAVENGVVEPVVRQRNGTLVETLSELESDIRLLVIGKRGAQAHKASEHLGSSLERVVRSLHRPILIVPDTFAAPQRVLIAFDGSETTRKGVEMMAASPLFEGLECHVVMIGADIAESRSQLDWALSALNEAGLTCRGEIRAGGDVEESLRIYQREQAIDLLIMGAYGHSRIRHLLVGSTTTTMLRRASIPVMILR